MEIRNESQFVASVAMAISLWGRRRRLLPELDVAADGEDELIDIEQRYQQFIADLTPFVMNYEPALEGMLQDPSESTLAVAAHLVMEGAKGSGYAPLLRTVGDEASKRYWACSEMLRYCSDSVFHDVVAAFLALKHVWVHNAIADPIAKRGATVYVGDFNDMIIDPRDNLPSNYIIRALGYIGNTVSLELLKAQLDKIDRKQLFNVACELARSIYMLGGEEGRMFYRDEIVREDMHVSDMAWWFAMFGEPADLHFLLERIGATQFPHWRADLLRSLGYLGHIGAVETLIEHLDSTDIEERLSANDALGELLGAVPDINIEDESDELVEWWRAWWSDQRKGFQSHVRYQRGEVFSLLSCLNDLKHPLPEERVRPHINLIIYTGQRFPFNPLGYVTQQRESIDTWNDWIVDNSDTLPAGAWWRWGHTLPADGPSNT